MKFQLRALASKKYVAAWSLFSLVAANLDFYVVENVLGQVDRKSRNERR